jgi:hypothetical protein
MKVGDILEVVAGTLATAAAWYKVGFWLALIVAAVSVFYLAQVYADTGTQGMRSLANLSIRAGDTVLIRVPASLEPEEFAATQAYVQKQLPENRVVVLPSTAEVASWRPRGYEEPVVSRKDRFRLWG